MKALLLAVLLLLAVVPAFAQEPAEPATPRSWQSLSPQQQQRWRAAAIAGSA